MKKIITTLILIALISYSCGKDGSGILTACYTCTATLVTTVSPSLTGYPQTVKTTTEPCNLTPAGARDVESALTSTSTTTSAGYNITVKQTAKCVKK